MRIWSLLLCVVSASLFVGAAFPGKATGPGQEAARIFKRAKAEDFKGDEYCAACHEDKVANFAGSPHAACMSSDKLPPDKRGCEGCHGAGGVHQAENDPEVVSFRSMSPKESSAACLRCHASTMTESHWKNSPHSKADLACVTCHKIHPDSEPQWADVSFKPYAPIEGSAGSSFAPFKYDLFSELEREDVRTLYFRVRYKVQQGTSLDASIENEHDDLGTTLTFKIGAKTDF